jgi:ABC-type antimicrobial peptide transport system permease subunit
MLQMPHAHGLLVRQAHDTPPDAIRGAVVDGRGDLPFLDVRSYAPPQDPRLVHWLTGTKLLLLFAALALGTAAVGIYGAFAHSVAERGQEIAVRLALGASRQRVRLMTLRDGTMVAASGVMYGAVVAVLAGWAARSMLFGLLSPGPLVIGFAGIVVLIVAILATWFPALAASRGDPNALLRAE